MPLSKPPPCPSLFPSPAHAPALALPFWWINGVFVCVLYNRGGLYHCECGGRLQGGVLQWEERKEEETGQLVKSLPALIPQSCLCMLMLFTFLGQKDFFRLQVNFKERSGVWLGASTRFVLVREVIFLNVSLCYWLRLEELYVLFILKSKISKYRNFQLRFGLKNTVAIFLKCFYCI